MNPPDLLGALIGSETCRNFFGVLTELVFLVLIGHYHKYASYKVKFAEYAKTGFIAYLNENPPIIVVEFMRKSI